MIVARPLDELESVFVSTENGAAPPTTVFYATEYRGDLRLDVMIDAYSEISRAYPVLRARIARGDYDWTIESSPDFGPQVSVRGLTDDALRNELAQSWDQEESLAHLSIIHGPSGGYVGIRADHLIVDGHHLISLLRELWRTYVEIVDGPPRESAAFPAALPSPPNSILRERWGQVYPRFTAQWTNSNAEPPSPGPAYLRRVRLDTASTTRIRNLARENGATVHSIVCGAVLLALCGEGQSASKSAMECISIADLRSRIQPRVGSFEITNLFATDRVTTDVSPTSSVLDIAHVVKAHLEHSFQNNEIDLSLNQGPGELATNLEPRHASAIVNSLGRIEKFDHSPEIYISDFLVVKTDSTYEAIPRFIAYTYGSRFSVLCCYPGKYFDQIEVDRICDRLRFQLERGV